MKDTLSELHYRIVLGLMAAIEKRFPVSFPRNCFRKSVELYLFGVDESDNTKPWIELKITGGGSGDYFSGSVDYEDIFRVKNLYISPGKRVDLDYNRQATNIAGDCSILTSSSFDEADWVKVEDDFYEVLNARGEVPVFRVFTT
ncbi:MAG: hypothetical protein IPP73_11360 [Chitinophagaceae bacterium]|nr:hypothetical protein [Chitinophagaceae bacterium]